MGSRILTESNGTFPELVVTVDGRPELIVRLRSDEEYEGFRSCESRRSFSLIFFCRLFIASKTLKSSMSSAFGLNLKLLRVVSSLVPLNLLIILKRLFPHCFSELKCDDDRLTSFANESFFKTSLDLLRGTIVISFSPPDISSPSAWLKVKLLHIWLVEAAINSSIDESWGLTTVRVKFKLKSAVAEGEMGFLMTPGSGKFLY